ncbi:hypothetical protein ACO0RG_004538 [Hanseniaspora osmophila]
MQVKSLMACAVAGSTLTSALLIPQFDQAEHPFQLNENSNSQVEQQLQQVEQQVAINTNDIVEKIEKIENQVDFNSWLHRPNWMKKTVDSEKLQEMITVEELNNTAAELYQVANASTHEYGHPTRIIGSPGHWATIDWILSKFDKHRDYYDVSLQEFPAVTGKVKSFNLTYTDGTNVKSAKPFALTPGVKNFTGKVLEVPNLGCKLIDYESVIPKKGKAIALIERGECSFGEKAKLAGKAGFHGAIIYDNEIGNTTISGTLGTPNKHNVATIGVNKIVGGLLKTAIELSLNDFYLNFGLDAYVEKIKTKNVIVETKHGDENNIVALGAHTDSVETGPGLNDDGSGTISLLTVAEHLVKFKVQNKVRFLFVSAEEEGLIGSSYYASHLSKKENSKIRLFMDYDMMASPNYQYQVYDANNIDHPNGSENLKNLYIDYYTSHGLNYSLIPFDGRSDYVGFLKADPYPIPAGGIATGAEGRNTDNGEVLDICYHSLCDDITNLNFDAFLTNTKLIAHSVATYGKSLEDFPKRNIPCHHGGKNKTMSATTKEVESNKPFFKYSGSNLVI